MDVRLDIAGVLQVEPTDRCNLRCAMCGPQVQAPDRPHGVPAGDLDPDRLRVVLDGIAADGVRFDHVLLQWLGEPSLHPDLAGLVGLAAAGLRGRAGYLRVDTNGVLLDPDRARALVDAWWPSRDLPLLLVFSLDAATRATYARVKGADLLDRVRRNVRRLLALRARLDAALHVQVQFVVQAGNAPEAGAFLRYWEAAFRCHGAGRGHDEVLFKRLSVGAGGPDQDEADRLYDRTLASQGIAPRRGPPCDVVTWERRPWDGHGPCPGPWMTPVIRHDGLVSPCCADVRGDLALGRVPEASFRALWEGPAALALRLAHVTGDLAAYPACAACGGIAWYGFPPATVRAWLASVGRLDLWTAYAARGRSGPRS